MSNHGYFLSKLCDIVTLCGMTHFMNRSWEPELWLVYAWVFVMYCCSCVVLPTVWWIWILLFNIGHLPGAGPQNAEVWLCSFTEFWWFLLKLNIFMPSIEFMCSWLMFLHLYQCKTLLVIWAIFCPFFFFFPPPSLNTYIDEDSSWTIMV